MGFLSKISWTDHTFNPWIGCTKVSAGCKFCYAEALADHRYHWAKWGPKGARRRTSEASWRKPVAWNKAAASLGIRYRVFCASLADVFDERAPIQARADLWRMIADTPHLDWQLLTKRPQNIKAMLPSDWGPGYRNVWLGCTTEDQENFDARWAILSGLPAALHFVSYEPAVGPLSIAKHPRWPDWLIWGGESGAHARLMQAQWARAVTSECYQRGIPVFGKQWGIYESSPLVTEQRMSLAAASQLDPPSNGKGGALLDGILWRGFPVAKLLPQQQQSLF